MAAFPAATAQPSAPAQSNVTCVPSAAYRAKLRPQRSAASAGCAAIPNKRTGVHRPARRILSEVGSPFESAGRLDGGARAAQQPLVGVLQLRIPQEDQVRELLRQRPGRPDQPHAGLTEQAVSLASVAASAGDHLVLPAVGGPATRGG